MLLHNSGSARLPGLTKSPPDMSRQLPCPAQVQETPKRSKTSKIHNFVHTTPFWTWIGPLESTQKALQDRTIYKYNSDSPIFTTCGLYTFFVMRPMVLNTDQDSDSVRQACGNHLIGARDYLSATNHSIKKAREL